MNNDLTHVAENGAARMVDVSAKTPTLRKATAEGFVTMGWDTWMALKKNTGPKGEVYPVARVAGIQAAKRTGELIPLCHLWWGCRWRATRARERWSAPESAENVGRQDAPYGLSSKIRARW